MLNNTCDISSPLQSNDKRLCIVANETFGSAIKRISEFDLLAVDTETTGLAPFGGDYACGVGVGVSENEAYYFPFYHIIPEYDSFGKLDEASKELWDNQLEESSYSKLFASIFSNGNNLIFHNAKFDIFQMIKSLKWNRTAPVLHSIIKNCNIIDTVIGARILWSNTFLPYELMKKLNLKGLADFFWKGSSMEESKIKKLMQSRKHTNRYNYLSPNELGIYCCTDCILTYKLFQKEIDEIKVRGIEKLFEQELNVLKSVLLMEWYGAKYDVKECDNFKELCEILKDYFQNKIDNDLKFHITVTKANDIIKAFDSKDISLKYYTAIAPGVAKKNAKKQRERELAIKQKRKKLPPKPTEVCTDKEVLLLTKTDLGKWIVDWKRISNLESTFLDNVRKRLDKDDIVHTSFHQAGAHTGRFSSFDPNLQNLPRGDGSDNPFELQSEVDDYIMKQASILNPRKLFIPRESNLIFVKIDYSQVEYRMLAFYSKDPKMIESFNAGKDLHQATCDNINSLLGEGFITRKHSKNVNFGMIYGMGAKGLAGMLEKSEAEVYEILNAYHKTYPTIRLFTERVRAKAIKQGYVTNLYGRRYSVPRDMEYKLVNYLIQGTCADMLKEKMVVIQSYLDDNNIHIKMILTIHDEIVFEFEPSEENWNHIANIKRIMEDFNEPIEGLRPAITTIPIVANLEVCPNNLFETVEL